MLARTAGAISVGLIASIAALQLSGCSLPYVPPTRIDVNDSNVRPVMASVVWRPEQFAHHGRHENRGGIELGYERFIGDGSQSLLAGNYVTFNGSRVNGPQDLSNSADYHHLHLGYDHLFALTTHFELEPLFVATYDTDEIVSTASTSAGRNISFSQSEWGFGVGLTPRWNFNQYLGLEARLRFGLGTEGSASALVAPALVIRPHKSVAVDVGYVSFTHDVETPESNSNVSLDYNGFNLALRLIF